jgi:hypothetical protein
MQGKKKFSEKLFTHFQLSDRVPEDNFYRRLKDVLNLQWLCKATKQYYGTEGRHSIGAMIFYIIAIIRSRKHLRLHRQLSKQLFKPDQHV